ncbi:DUF2933 domain-containing protein [Thermosediminibacter litoriperuensis]|uniref:DUF2933 family protein n=1 Tax=Thermosediminibacter litoriperuensis TaxID=291989 RepID=A0A5S5AWB1_9FIRM|nr:DUF2933 domain-containing protein [Thermosediminibacter litoriperuensis]TYP57641.1 Protein of unknown function (DUF2933) [Thermosediminibacter litoriperuensis]
MSKNSRGLVHTLLMSLCCVFMLVAIALLARKFGASGNIFSYALILLCPLMHVLMMMGILGGHNRSCHEGGKSNRDKVGG